MTTGYSSHAELLNLIKEGKSLQYIKPEDIIYVQIAQAICLGYWMNVSGLLDIHPEFIPDQELVQFASSLPSSMNYLIKRQKENNKVTKPRNEQLEKFTRDFCRLSITALEELSNLYPTPNSSAEAEEFRKLFATRQREEEQAKKAIDLAIQNDNSGPLDPHMPLRATTFRYLVEKSGESSIVQRYLAILYVVHQPDDLSLSDALEYHSILTKIKDKSKTHWFEANRFAIWQRNAPGFASKMAEQGHLNILQIYCRIGCIPRETLFNSINPSVIESSSEKIELQHLKESDLAKVSKTITTVAALACFGIRSRAEITHIEKGNELFESWRATLPDISSTTTTKC